MSLGRPGRHFHLLTVAPLVWALLQGCGGSNESATRGAEGEDDSGLDATADGNDAASMAEPDAGHPDAGADSTCGAVTAAGSCTSDDRFEVCVQPTGAAGSPALVQFACRVGERCDDTLGMARCVQNSECVGDETSCADASTLRSCEAGAWSESPCASRCVQTPLGSACAPDVTTTTLNARVRLAVQRANAERTDWGAASFVEARGFLVLSYDGDALVDSKVTGVVDADAGAFSILTPAAPSDDDTLVIVAAGQDSAGKLAFAVGNPGYAPSSSVYRPSAKKPPDARIWSFSLKTNSVTEGSTISIDGASGSGAAHVFETLRKVHAYAADFYAPSEAPSVLVWVGLGVQWDCGACMGAIPARVDDALFAHQIWLDGSAENQGYWSDSVTAHELGHYVMSAHGFPPAEGGGHYLTFPTNPGQAWSEGFATFFSGMWRKDPIYIDKQEGTFFWLDLDARSYSLKGFSWTRPTAAGGLVQLIDENEVAALLRATELTLDDAAPLLRALASERMLTPPFERGYKRREWTDAENPGAYTATNESIPHLADFFDALRCDGSISAEALDAVTVPSVHYPYPSASPLCR
jgi:hypothetical protein